MDRPPALELNGVSLREIARRHHLQLLGRDRVVRRLALLRADQGDSRGVLTYVTSEPYAGLFEAGSHKMAVVERRFAPSYDLTDKSLLVCDDSQGEATFFRIHIDAVNRGLVPSIESRRGARPSIHPTAVLMDGVQIGDDVVVGPHSVVYPNSIIGARVMIKANATIGGEGFEVKYLAGKRVLIPHSGGVILGDDVTVGSSSCIDRGLFGTFTTIGTGTKIDNLVYVAHNSDIGEDCAIAGGASILGSTHLGKGVWFGPAAACNHEIKFGDYSYVGTGAVVIRDVPPFTLVAGSPARQLGPVCRCRTRLEPGSVIECPSCGTQFASTPDGEIRITEMLAQ